MPAVGTGGEPGPSGRTFRACPPKGQADLQASTTRTGITHRRRNHFSITHSSSFQLSDFPKTAWSRGTIRAEATWRACRWTGAGSKLGTPSPQKAQTWVSSSSTRSFTMSGNVPDPGQMGESTGLAVTIGRSFSLPDAGPVRGFPHPVADPTTISCLHLFPYPTRPDTTMFTSPYQTELPSVVEVVQGAVVVTERFWHQSSGSVRSGGRRSS